MPPPTEERRPRVASAPDLRIIVGGKAGVGKSTAISTILGADELRNEVFSASPLKEVEKRKGMVRGRHVSIIDTPGLLDKKLSVEEVKSNIGKCYSLSSPGPHVFLLVLKVGQFSKEENDAIKIIQSVFGDRALSYTMILFTHGDNLKALSVDSYLERSSKDLQEMVRKCGYRYHVFNSKNPNNHKQVIELLEKIDKMVASNGGMHYTNEIYRKAEENIVKRQEELLKGIAK
ncbi:GIMA7 GTPase, partial [Polypterus senegalus]